MSDGKCLIYLSFDPLKISFSGLVSLGVSEIVGFLHSFGGASIHWVVSFYLAVGILIFVGVCIDGGHFTLFMGIFFIYLCCGRIPLCERLKSQWAFFICRWPFLISVAFFHLLMAVFN
jgi:hypothetical protein